MSMRLWSYPVAYSLLFKAWGVHYLLWGIICWGIWWWLGERIQQAGLSWMLKWLLPLSIVASFAEEMIWVMVFPDLPLNRPQMTFWSRFWFELDDDLLHNIVICWFAFGLYRGIGYYYKYREKEKAATQLEIQLATAQISALRMQLNPHFLFNAMNSISSLMQTDVEAADTMLEELGSLLRITLKRGDAQLITLRDEIEFIELYLSMQDRRFSSRVKQSVKVDAELHDVLVPAMILQPIVENAYAHGLSKLDEDGFLRVEAHREGNRIRLSVTNNGVGLLPPPTNGASGRGLGLSNVKARLRLHYGQEQSFAIRELESHKVQVSITFPLQMARHEEEQLTRFGA